MFSGWSDWMPICVCGSSLFAISKQPCICVIRHTFPHTPHTSFRLSLFLSLWGLIVLIPVYGTSRRPQDNSFDHYSISNVDNSNMDRLWFPAIFGYVFGAYFCQLLYAEYNNFSVRRLQYFVQVSSRRNINPSKIIFCFPFVRLMLIAPMRILTPHLKSILQLWWKGFPPTFGLLKHFINSSISFSQVIVKTWLLYHDTITSLFETFRWRLYRGDFTGYCRFK